MQLYSRNNSSSIKSPFPTIRPLDNFQDVANYIHDIKLSLPPTSCCPTLESQIAANIQCTKPFWSQRLITVPAPPPLALGIHLHSPSCLVFRNFIKYYKIAYLIHTIFPCNEITLQQPKGRP